MIVKKGERDREKERERERRGRVNSFFNKFSRRM